MRAWVAGVVAGVCAGFVLVPGVASAAPVPEAEAEADLAFHGTALMAGDTVDVRLTPRNNGPAAVPDATVRLRWSVPLAVAQQLPARCVREDERTVVCSTGALAVNGVGEQVEVPVRLEEKASEVTLEIGTVWGGGAVDRDHTNDELKVLVLDTGDAYAF
ncbi:hypothetical protein O1G22_18105 [Streptomyces camelliae]|uniref:DUF11 domain-containing protein n=1 Tax=Streptomyces camelliae TaxID=3004093 RepID=A0ABY7PJF0_9ACTN|nr:hypothetical protein [Streptomyces sp. HUAS 2-6]WBO69251.1 hypothetical protein O1G22_18105 [Streptomyces sp. HUAS 2-6]